MKHNHKIGKCIKDKELKVIKLFLGDLNLMDSVKIPRYCDYLTNSLVKIKSIRKYSSAFWVGKKFCYEIDIDITLDPEMLRGYRYLLEGNKRRINGHIRYALESSIRDQMNELGLVYNMNLVLDKINIKKK
jgi:hypothetical protein